MSLETEVQDFWKRSTHLRALPTPEQQEVYRKTVVTPNRDMAYDPYRRKLWDRLCG